MVISEKTQKRAQYAEMLSALMQNLRRLRVGDERLVAEAGRDGDLVTALGATAVEYSSAGFGSHANEEAVDLATAATVRLEGALWHRNVPVKKCLLEGECRALLKPGWRSSGGLWPEPVTRVQGLKTPAPQQVLSVSELRKTGNEYRRRG
jgi:hypothetical protein